LLAAANETNDKSTALPRLEALSVDNPFRALPSVSQLLDSPPLKKLIQNVNHNVVADGVRSFLDNLRQQMTQAAEKIELPTSSELAEKIATWLQKERRPALRPVINGTGILLHTGLGRAPLAEAAIRAIEQTARGYSSLEIDLENGERGQRAEIVRRLLCELTGAEDAVVVNNNAAATMLALATVAAHKEVIVSRGQLVEIGGSYRLPEVMACAGCHLREVGTTNKTRLADYELAIGEQTGALLRVHPSNYEIVGFTESVSIQDLVQLGQRHSLPVIDDIGSGALLDFTRFGLADEPQAAHSIAAGADLVLFSGDKLVGGPQAGIIVGTRKWVQAVLKHPLMRAMRVDKMTLAGLHATLELHLKPEQAEQQIPLLAMLATPLANLELRAKKLAGLLTPLALLQNVAAIPEFSMLGGGSIPSQKIPTWCVSCEPAVGSLQQLASQLRQLEPAVMGRIHQGRFLLDLRTIPPRHDPELINLLESFSRQVTQASAPATQSQT
jgi:L-seryl-tRNA(Ser) seleniumtransferase